MSFQFDSMSSDDVYREGVSEEKRVYSVAEVYKNYEWVGKAADFKRVLEQIEAFFGGVGSKLKQKSEAVMFYMEDSLQLASDWYKESFPNSEMTYHDEHHVKFTTAVGMKMFLSRLAVMHEKSGGKGIFEEPEKIDKLINTASAVFALHEYDDWWKRNVSKDDAEGQAKIIEREQELRKKLESWGIDWNDFVILSTLDNFKKPLDQTVSEAPTAGGSRLLSYVSDEEKNDVLYAMGGAVSGADFAQICNPSYSEDVTIEVDGVKYATMRGLVALAEEMVRYRPNALKDVKWNLEGSDPPTVDWKKVIWSRYFYKNIALPRINYMKDDLEMFDRTERANMDVILDRLKVKLDETDPIVMREK